jgi:hypothetical protein
MAKAGKQEAPATIQGMCPRVHAIVFPKKSGTELATAQARVNEVYAGTYPRAAAAPQGSGRARAAGRCLHLARHHLPTSGEDRGAGLPGWLTLVRLGAVSIAAACWLLCYPRPVQLRTLACALVYSGMESAFTLVERYAAAAQRPPASLLPSAAFAPVPLAASPSRPLLPVPAVTGCMVMPITVVCLCAGHCPWVATHSGGGPTPASHSLGPTYCTCPCCWTAMARWACRRCCTSLSSRSTSGSSK